MHKSRCPQNVADVRWREAEATGRDGRGEEDRYERDVRMVENCEERVVDEDAHQARGEQHGELRVSLRCEGLGTVRGIAIAAMPTVQDMAIATLPTVQDMAIAALLMLDGTIRCSSQFLTSDFGNE